MLLRILQISLFGIFVGSISSLVAIGFVDLVQLLNHHLLVSPRSRMMMDAREWLVFITILTPTLGGLLVGILCCQISGRRAHGPPHLIMSVQKMDGRVGVKDGLLSAAASIISLGCGASVGQYGPLAHLGASIGSWMGQGFKKARYFAAIGIACGSAAAIATVFNAPIAGLLFAHEVILRHYSLRAFAPVTIASTVGYVMANSVFQREPLFRVETFGTPDSAEYITFALIGAIGAFIAIFFMRSILWMTATAERLTLPTWIRPAIAGLGLGLVAIWIPDILGSGDILLRFAVIQGAFSFSELILIIIAKILLTAFCLGFGFAGGVFSPSLVIGILFGAFFGQALDLFQLPHSDVAIYAIAGMVAVTSPIIGAPLSVILIVFELTRNYDLATVAMLSVVVSNLISYRLFGRSLFDKQLRNRGFDISEGRDQIILGGRKIADYVINECYATHHATPLGEMLKALTVDTISVAHLLDDNSHYHSSITLNRILSLQQEGIGMDSAATEHGDQQHLFFTPDTNVLDAMKKMQDFVGENIPVIDKDSRVFLGVVHESSVIRAYLQTLNTIRKDEYAT